MNIEKNLILVKGEDQTSKIKYCKYENGKYIINYLGGKSYKYNYNNVIWLRDHNEVNIENKVIYLNGKALNGVEKLIKFESYIKVIYKNKYTQTVPKYEIRVEESCLNDKKSKNCFEYFKEISREIGLTIDGSKNFLEKQYDKISFISPNSVLSYYLNPKDIKKNNYNDTMIFPFRFNLSQKEAAEKALSNSISIIEGPPGTGKTQTILNIIANILLQDKTVAVLSNNNAAIDNIFEKLKSNNLDFICSVLGKKENKDNFIENQSLRYTDMSSWEINYEKLQKLKQDILNSQTTLDNMLQKKNELARLRQQYNDLNIEYKHFLQEYIYDKTEVNRFKSLFKLNSDKLMNFVVNMKLSNTEEYKVTLKDKLINLFKYGIVNFKIYKIPINELIDDIYIKYYETKNTELTNEIHSIEKELHNYNFDNEMKTYSENSLAIFKNYLYTKYSKNNERPQFTQEDLWNNFDDIMREYPVLLSTTHSIRNCISTNYMFDYVIIDEASQVDLLTGVLSLSCTKNIVVVGDLKQLTNVIEERDKIICNDIFKRYELDEVYNFSNNNLLSSISKLNKYIPRTLLREHYRCHPQIIDYCNKKFYNSELIVLTESNENDNPLVLYKTNEGNHARGKVNQRQIDVIRYNILPTIEDINSIGIIAPYRLQVHNISEYVSGGIQIDTVHKFQGREKDIIILSTVSNTVNDFIDNSNIINVAVSRAVKKLIVVTSDFENTKSNIGDLINYIQYNNLEIIESEVSSIFDLLYKSYSNKLLEVLKKSKKISDFNSENLMYELITNILSYEKYNFLDVAVHVPLKMLIRNINKLNSDEKKFVLNPWTHSDFIIFNKINKMPILAIEVDGYKYHVESEKQIRRDMIKDNILDKYRIPNIRFRTDGSREKEKLINKLNEILK
ncbi:AAA family ATPase [Clostridium tertium]|uniref:Exonuclease V subunit alpha n=1 Tax=Clostridium tertium TaxID=1559 RepID=A0A6N2YRI9_9CLOT